jgi:hypothetical protein
MRAVARQVREVPVRVLGLVLQNAGRSPARRYAVAEQHLVGEHLVVVGALAEPLDLD